MKILLARNIIYLSFFLFISTSTFTLGVNNDTSHIEIEKVYENKEKELLVKFHLKFASRDKNKLNPDFFGSNLFFFGSEKKLYQLHNTGFSGNSKFFRSGFIDTRIENSVPERQHKGEIFSGIDPIDPKKKTLNHYIVCGNTEKSIEYKITSEDKRKELQEKIRQKKIPLTPLPKEIRMPRYLFKQASGTVIYLDSPKYYTDPLRLFIGTPGAMKELKVKNFELLRDGGTIQVTTEDDKALYAPSPWRKGEKITWNKTDIFEKVDIQSFNLASLGIKNIPSKEAVLHTPCDRFFFNSP